jgi:hypothetical protein
VVQALSRELKSERNNNRAAAGYARVKIRRRLGPYRSVNTGEMGNILRSFFALELQRLDKDLDLLVYADVGFIEQKTSDEPDLLPNGELSPPSDVVDEGTQHRYQASLLNGCSVAENGCLQAWHVSEPTPRWASAGLRPRPSL